MLVVCEEADCGRKQEVKHRLRQHVTHNGIFLVETENYVYCGMFVGEAGVFNIYNVLLLLG